VNVWTPSPHVRGHQRRPVLFYIHGGAYNSGTVNSVLYDGTRLCKRGDVVVVTVNHRLNALGYFYLAGVSADPKYAESGNVGMLDLVLGLHWVKNNIASFGGDPSRVTIFGQSGGGAKCATLMAMPAAQGLFHRVMTMSGQQVTAAPETIATARTRDFLAKLGLTTPDDTLRSALDAMPLERLQDAARVSSAWLPVVDGRSLPRDPFSPDAPSISNNVPMILGNTHDETRGLIGGGQPALFSLTWDQLPSALEKNVGNFLGPVKPETMVAKYREWYPQYSPADIFFAATTAFRSWPGQVIEAERRAESPAQPRTWVYEMDWPSPVAAGKFGAPHTVDIPFFFDNLAVAPGMVGGSAEEVERAQPLARAMSQTLIAFAKAGDPNHPGLPHWPTYELKQRATMIWNTPPHVLDDPRKNERELASQAHYRQPGT
jgi:para-nitrobenzyl esterase